MEESFLCRIRFDGNEQSIFFSFSIISLILALTVGSPSVHRRDSTLIDYFQLPFEIKFKVFIMFYIF